MAIYLYKGYDKESGSVKRGKIEADGIKSARQKLRRENIIPSEIKEEAELSSAKKGGSLFGTTVSLSELAVMTRQFATLLSAQVPLDECLKALTAQVDNPLLKNTLSSIKAYVSEGKSLADAVKTFPGIFSHLYVNMVRAGESSGSLGLVLERLADFLEYQVAVKGKVFSSMAYPGIMMSASFIIIVYLFVSVVPKMQKIFVSTHATMPWYTKSLIHFSESMQSQWYFYVAGIMVAFFIFRSWYRTDSGRIKVDGWSLTVPIFGGLIIRLNVSKFTKTLSTLLSSGVPIIEALDITKNIIENRVISNVIVHAKQAVQEGESLGDVIENSGKFPPLVSHMIKTGEKTGELEKMLKHVADSYDAEVERKIDAMIAMIEPLMMIVMGGVVAVIVMALLVPMLTVMNTVKH